MTQLSSVVTYLDSLLSASEYQDHGLNGLQVESSNQDIRKVAVAVDAGQSIIDQAIEESADLLIVHHGIIWGKTQAISGIFGKKINSLLSNRCSLYASHLPLDGNMEVGNNVELARFFKLEQIEPCFTYAGGYIGVKAMAPKPVTIEALVEQFVEVPGALEHPTIFPFGPKQIEKIGIASGSGSALIPEAKKLGLDLLISGEPKQEGYHSAKEYGIHALFLGHYATETFGVKALAQRLEKDFDLSTVFLHEGTGV